MESIYEREIKSKFQQHYKIKTVAELYQISEKTIRRWIHEGKLKVIRIGGSIRIPKSEIIRFIESVN